MQVLLLQSYLPLLQSLDATAAACPWTCQKGGALQLPMMMENDDDPCVVFYLQCFSVLDCIVQIMDHKQRNCPSGTLMISWFLSQSRWCKQYPPLEMAKWKFGSGYQITWRLTCACCQSCSSTSCCCSHGLNTIQSHAPVQSSARSSQPSEKQNKPTHTHKRQLEESIHLATFVQQASLDDVCSWWEP